jgi:hypothetical protein
MAADRASRGPSRPANPPVGIGLDRFEGRAILTTAALVDHADRRDATKREPLGVNTSPVIMKDFVYRQS